MNQSRIIALLVFAMITTVAFAQTSEYGTTTHAVNICSVIADPTKYDGKEIFVEALYRVVIHGAILMGGTCPETNVAAREVEGYKADKHATAVLQRLLKKDKSEPVEIVVRGTFHLAHQGQCFGGEICSSYEVEIAELLSAQAVSPRSVTAPAAPAPETLVHESGHADPPKPQ